MSIWIYIIVMAVVTYLIRMIPFTFFTKEIKSRFVRSVFYYLPYAIISAMTFPAIFYSTGNVITASVGTAVAVVLACFDLPMFVVAVGASASALITGLII